jgi:hypothetical protein
LRRGDVRSGRTAIEGRTNRTKLQCGAEPEQKREDRNELGRDERADQKVRDRIAERRNGQELAERIAAAPDERLDIDLKDAGKRKGTKRVDEFDALSASREVTQSALRPFARSSP